MRPEEDATHYLSADKVPQLDEALNVSGFFRALHAAGAGGAVVWRGGAARYVSGKEVAHAVTTRASASSFAEATRVSLADYLNSVTTYPVEAKTFSTDSDVAEMSRGAGAPEVVRRVVDEAVVQGFVFARESMRNTAVVPPPIWVCVDGDDNVDPDDGYCAHCPAEIKGLKP